MKHILSSLKVASVVLAGTAAPTFAQGEPYIGQIMNFGFNFCPRGWAQAAGQLLPISQNTALFSILGTTYGGDGRTSMGLPDLRSRRVVGVGRGPGLNEVRLGQKSGAETLTIDANSMAAHKHLVNATNEIANKNGPGTDFLAIPNLDHDIYHEGPSNKVMDPGTLSPAGQVTPLAVSKTSPSLGMNWCVALIGLYPSRS
jgi:microcystin-dependent protein